MQKILQSLLPFLLLAGYLSLSLFSLFHMGHMAEMGMSMDECPYLILRETPGSDFFAHLEAWKSLTLIIFPSAELLLFLSFSFLFVSLNSVFSQRLTFYFRRTRGEPPDPLFQILFSAGILHPKAP